MKTGTAWGAWFGFLASWPLVLIGVHLVEDGPFWPVVAFSLLGTPIGVFFGTMYGAICGAIAGPAVRLTARRLPKSTLIKQVSPVVAASVALPTIGVLSWSLVDHTNLGGIFEEPVLRYWGPWLAAVIASRPFAGQVLRTPDESGPPAGTGTGAAV